MKVVFIFPGIAETGFNKSGQPIEYCWLHQGLCTISASTKAKGHSVELIDLRELSGWDEVRAKIKELSPDVIGITVMDVDKDFAIESAKIAKSCDSRIKVVIGGPYASLVPKEASSFSSIDHVIVGEGEISFTKLLDDIEKGRPSEKVIMGEPPDLDKLPFADRELFHFQEQPLERFLQLPFVTLIAGRGCGHDCSYCQPAERMIFGNRIRRRSVANTIEELKILRDKYDFQSILFNDDSFTQNRKWIFEFCEEYIKNKFRKPFICQSRADIIVKNEDMVRLMKRAGLCMFIIGFESGNQRILDFLRKRTTVETNLKAAKLCRKIGVRIWANYMLGIPTETKEEVMDTVNMILKIRPYRPSPTFFSPHPGTDLFDFCNEHNLSIVERSVDYLRSSSKPKVKNIDYDFIQQAIKMSKKRFLDVRLARKIDFIREQRIKQPLRKFCTSLKLQ
ncbi:MAG: radical SAM protein [Candidatus Omnitrophota bacterium]